MRLNLEVFQENVDLWRDWGYVLQCTGLYGVRNKILVVQYHYSVLRVPVRIDCAKDPTNLLTQFPFERIASHLLP